MDEIEWSGQAAALDGAGIKLVQLNKLAQSFGKAMTGAFSSGIAQGKSLEDILGKVGQKFIDIGLKAAMQPVQAGLTAMVGQLFSGLGSGLGALTGGGAGSAPVTPFADGGVIAAPGYFPLGRGLGLAGEAGPEAILPLQRGADGRLGVSASGGGGVASVTVNIQTPDVEGFARSQAQVSAAIARAVSRGRRGM